MQPTFGRKAIASTAVALDHTLIEPAACKTNFLSGKKCITALNIDPTIRKTPELSSKHRLSSNAGNVMWRICHLQQHYTYLI